MKIQIGRVGDKIIKSIDYSNIKDSGEIAHIICDLKLIKLELLAIWEDYEDE